MKDFTRKAYLVHSCAAAHPIRLTSSTLTCESSRYLSFAFTGAILITYVVQDAVGMKGELRIYKEADFKRLLRIIRVSTENLCYNMPCADLSGVISSAKLTGLPATGWLVKIAFYTGSNCACKSIVLNTNAEEVRHFADFGIDDATTSFAVLQTSTAMEHAGSNIVSGRAEIADILA